MPVLEFGWCPGICTMAWQQINYFAVADVKLWDVKVSLPRWFWEKNQSNHCISSSLHISVFMNMVEITMSNDHITDHFQLTSQSGSLTHPIEDQNKTKQNKTGLGHSP